MRQPVPENFERDGRVGIIAVGWRHGIRYSPESSSSIVMNMILVGIGGALGSMVRHGVGVAMARVAPAGVSPYATMTVNLAGCLAIGVLAGLVASHRLVVGPAMRAFVFVGVLGGFTTFSTFGLDTFTLAHGGRTGAAALNVAIQVAAGLALVAAGYAVAARVQ